MWAWKWTWPLGLPRISSTPGTPYPISRSISTSLCLAIGRSVGNTGVTWQVGDDGGQFAQWNLPWSLVYAFNDNFEMYWHGLLNLPGSSGLQEELVTGAGLNFYLGDQWSIWGNYNWGLTQQSDFRCVLVGPDLRGKCPAVGLLAPETTEVRKFSSMLLS